MASYSQIIASVDGKVIVISETAGDDVRRATSIGGDIAALIAEESHDAYRAFLNSSDDSAVFKSALLSYDRLTITRINPGPAAYLRIHFEREAKKTRCDYSAAETAKIKQRFYEILYHYDSYMKAYSAHEFGAVMKLGKYARPPRSFKSRERSFTTPSENALEWLRREFDRLYTYTLVSDSIDVDVNEGCDLSEALESVTTKLSGIASPCIIKAECEPGLIIRPDYLTAVVLVSAAAAVLYDLSKDGAVDARAYKNGSETVLSMTTTRGKRAAGVILSSDDIDNIADVCPRAADALALCRRIMKRAEGGVCISVDHEKNTITMKLAFDKCEEFGNEFKSRREFEDNINTERVVTLFFPRSDDE